MQEFCRRNYAFWLFLEHALLRRNDQRFFKDKINSVESVYATEIGRIAHQGDYGKQKFVF